jgi:uncharacterized protein
MAKQLTAERLRRMAIAASFGAPTTLGGAIRRFGFVQADPIRAPARAQDLILRHRVADYRIGDAERRFARLGLEEDFLYAYGVMTHETWRLLHPRHDLDDEMGRHVPDALAASVLAFVRERGSVHPRDLEAEFGRERAVNGWGGWSKATTRALQRLQYYGLLRVVARQDGIRVYAPATTPSERLAAEERTRRLLALTVRILAPMPERSLAQVAGLLRRAAPDLTDASDAIEALLATGELERGEVEGERYLWHPGLAAREPAREVRLLAPFDPLVWDRRRFEALWQWEYRFEAYTPPKQRRFGYYAMPVLWGGDVIGWANVTASDGEVDVALGFVEREPRGREFRNALDAEVARMEAFFTPRTPARGASPDSDNSRDSDR